MATPPVSSTPPAAAAPAKSGGCCSRAPVDPEASRGMLPDGKRKCRDLFGCLIFLLFWVGMFVIGGLAIRFGKWQRLVFGSDYNGNVCGSDVSGMYITYPRINEDFLLNYGKTNPATYSFFGICQQSCPKALQVVCKYDSDVVMPASDPTPLSKLPPETLAQAFNASVPENTLNTIITKNCWVTPQVTSSVLFRCIPSYDVRNNDTTVCSYPPGVTSAADSRCILATSTTVGTIVKPAKPNILFDQLNTSQQIWGRWFGDLARAWWVILVCAVGFALVVGFTFVTLLKYCTGCMVWSVIILCLLLLSFLTGFFYYLAGYINNSQLASVDAQLSAIPGYSKAQTSFTSASASVSAIVPASWGSDSASYQGAYAAIAYTSTAVLIIVICIVVALRRSISLAVEVLKLGAEALRATPTLVFFPCTTVLALALFLVWWVFVAACLVSSGDKVTVDNVYSQIATGSAAFANAAIPGANVNSASLLNSPSINSTLTSVSPRTGTEYLLIYHFFGLLWTASFIQGITSLTVAGTVAGWYFSQLPKANEGDPELEKLRYARGRLPVCSALWRTLRYHLGSIALGSLLIALIQGVRAVFAYISRNLEKSAGNNNAVKFFLCCVNCCLKCVQTCIEVVTRTSYVYIAIKGEGFLRAGRRVFGLLSAHGKEFVVVNVLAEVIVFLGKIFISVISAFIAYAILQNVPMFLPGGANALSSTWLPVLVTLFFAYFTATGFMSIFDLAVDTVLVCYVTDIDENVARNGGDAKHAVPIHSKSDRFNFKGKMEAAAATKAAAGGAAKGGPVVAGAGVGV